MAPHNPPRIFRRVPFETAVRLRFDNFSGFVTQYSGNISLGGMFIRSDSSPPVGTQVEIEFKLDDDFDLIRGRGKVIWVRDAAAAPDLEPGLGVRFVELTPGSRELIFQVVDRYVRQGGTPFDLEEEAARAGGLAAGGSLSAGSGRGPNPAPSQVPTAREEQAPPDVAPPPAPDLEPPATPWPSPVERAETPLPGPIAATPVPPAPAAARDRLQGYGTARRSSGRIAALAAAAAVLVTGGVALYAARDRLAGWVASRGADARPEAPVAAPPVAAPEPHTASATPPPSPVAVPAVEESAAPAPDTSAATGEAPAGADDHSPAAPVPAEASAVAPPESSDPADRVALPPASHILRITWSQEGNATDLVLWADGTLDPAAVRHARIDGPLPREVLRIAGIAGPLSPADLTVGSAELRRVRSGSHPELSPPELHVVLDLASSRVAMTSLDAAGARIRIRLEGR